MIRRAGNKQLGVLNDFDLAILAEQDHHNKLERTGTIPFMAIELLSDEGAAGKIEHRLRHDLEATFWVLVWVFACASNDNDGIQDPPSALERWLHADYQQCALLKRAWCYQPTTLWPSDTKWGHILLVIDLFREALSLRKITESQHEGMVRRAAFLGHPIPEAPQQMTDAKEWIWYRDQLSTVASELPPDASVTVIIQNFLAMSELAL